MRVGTNPNTTWLTIGFVIAILVAIIALLGVIGVVPMSAQVVFGLILALAIARLV